MSRFFSYSTNRGAPSHPIAERKEPMLFWLGVILLIAWITGFGVFHVASAAIHVLIALALLSIVMHFVRGKQRGDR